MPFSFGLHPYFNVANLSKIKLEGLLDTCTNYLDISQSKSEKQLTSLKKGVDFLSGPSKLISLIDFEAGSRLELKHYPPMDLTVVWTDPPRSMICVEPWTSPRDSLLTRDRIIELDAGEMQTLRCTFSAYDEI